LSEGCYYLDLADYLLIAEAVLGIDVVDLLPAIQIGLAQSALAAPAAEFDGVELYPEFATKVAVLCSHLIRNHPLPDGNKRVGFLCAVEFAERNGYGWEPPLREAVLVIEGVAAGTVTGSQLAEWIRDRLSQRSGES